MSVHLAPALACVIEIQWLAVIHYLHGDATLYNEAGTHFITSTFWAANQHRSIVDL